MTGSDRDKAITELIRAAGPFAYMATWVEAMYEVDGQPGPGDDRALWQFMGNGGSHAVTMGQARGLRTALATAIDALNAQEHEDER